MEKIKKYSIINLICVVLICFTKLTQTYLINQDTFLGRRISFYLGLFITSPALIVSIITFVLILILHKKNNRVLTIKGNYLLVPFIVMIFALLIIFLLTLLKSL